MTEMQKNESQILLYQTEDGRQRIEFIFKVRLYGLAKN
jgi:hypothetical protein